MLYRRANEDDLIGLLRIEDECFGKERFSAEIVRAFIVRADAFTVVADDERLGRLVGSASCLVSEDAGEGRIASIAVIQSHRKIGIGSGLMDECERIFASFRLRKYLLEVETTNFPAILLYTHRGYSVMGLLKDYYGTGRDAYFMERRLCRNKRRIIVQ